MKTKIIFLLSAIVFAFSLSAQNITGTWSGDLEVQGMKLPLVLHIQQNKDSLTSTLDSPMQGAKDIAVDITTFSANELRFEIKKLTVVYEGKFSGDSIQGTFKQGGMYLPLKFKKAGEKATELKRPQMPQPPFNYNIEEVSFINAAQGNTLAGTLTTPKDKNNFPLVVLITGSGAQDRDETLLGHKPFWVIADHFTKNGIGVLRLDDRGVGGSSKGKEDVTSADFATDIDAAVKYLQKRGFKNIGLVGHSEGGMIAPIVATKNKDVKFIVLMAGPGVPIDQLMAAQTYAISKASGATEQEARESVETNKKIYSFIKNYKGDSLEKDMKVIISKELENNTEVKAMAEKQKMMIVQQQVKMVASPWFRYFIKFNPQEYLTKIKIPVLAIDGILDVQVTAKENLASIKSALQKAGNKKFETIELPGLNHLFQEAKTGAPTEYGQIEQTVSPKALDIMTNWILKTE